MVSGLGRPRAIPGREQVGIRRRLLADPASGHDSHCRGVTCWRRRDHICSAHSIATAADHETAGGPCSPRRDAANRATWQRRIGRDPPSQLDCPWLHIAIWYSFPCEVELVGSGTWDLLAEYSDRGRGLAPDQSAEQGEMYTARMDPNPQESPDDARVLGDDPEAGRREEVHSRPNSGSAHRGDGGDGQFADLYEPVIGSAHALESVRLRGIFAGPLQEMTRPPEQNVPPAPRTTTAPTSRSRSMASQISRTHRADSVSRAFRVSGSSSEIVATCDSTSRSTGTRSAFALSALGGSPVLHPSASTSTGKITGEPERDGSARPPPSARHDIVAALVDRIELHRV